jgi:peptide/nickel transport system substrate-binding protein
MISRRGRSGRSLYRSWSLISTLIVSSLLLACAQPAAPSAPTAAPAKPAEAAKPAAPAAAPTAAPAAAAKPAEAAKPAAQPAAGPAKGQLVLVVESEPDTIVTKDTSTNISYFVNDNVYDHLTYRDWSSGSPKLVGELAESWSRPDPTTWRFKLRQGIKFNNGEPFNADAVVAAVLDHVDPAATGRAYGEWGQLKSASKVDEFTADITTTEPDAILPEKLSRFSIPAPGWLKSVTPEARANAAVGSGPYNLVEWNKGSHLLLRANENYWGPVKPTIAEIKIVGRKEATVRASMAKTGEATIGYLIPPDMMQDVPRTIIEPTMETPGIRLNPQHPVMKDLRVRQAMVYAIDTNAIIQAFYPGGVAVPLNGQLVRKGGTGYNPELKDYPYQPAEAKRLLQEAGAVGTQLELVTRSNYWPRADEVTEAVANALSEVGLKVNIRGLEMAQWREALAATKPDQQHTDMLVRGMSNPILDSSRLMDQSHLCGARNSLICDATFDKMLKDAGAASGEERNKLYQAAWKYAHDQIWYIPLFGLDYVHAVSPKLKWAPNPDGVILFSQMALED